jgi:hypothetical protein
VVSTNLPIGGAIADRLVNTLSEKGDPPFEIVFRNKQDCGFVLQDGQLGRVVEFVCGVEKTILEVVSVR